MLYNINVHKDNIKKFKGELFMDKHLFKENGTGTIATPEIDEKVDNCITNIVNIYGTEYNLAELELYVLELVMDNFVHARIENVRKKVKETE
jgi:hypothetical protein